MGLVSQSETIRLASQVSLLWPRFGLAIPRDSRLDDVMHDVDVRWSGDVREARTILPNQDELARNSLKLHARRTW